MQKGINDIDYNHLNLPERVYKDIANQVQYHYDAAGVKRTKTAIVGGSSNTTEYTRKTRRFFALRADEAQFQQY